MRFSVWRLAALVCCVRSLPLAAAATAAPTPAIECFDFPIVIISPVDKPFPTKQCVQPPGPAENCLKAPTLVDVEVIDKHDANGTALRNCVSDPRTGVYRSTANYRGQSSLGFNKHQYSINLHEPAPLLGFPTETSFVFNGPHIDGSLIRNHMAQWLFRSTGRWTPKTRFMIVYERNTATKAVHYHGVYLALEKISYGPSRVGLAPLTNECNSSQLNGGWAWQLNPLNFGVYSPNVVVDQYQLMFGPGSRPVLMHPRAEVLTQTMRDYFVNTSTGPLPQFYRYLFDNMTSPDGLEKHIDIGSFVDYFLHSEMSQNTDAFRRSTYFFKDRDQPINAGPVWDLNLAYGTGNKQADWLHNKYFLWKRLFVNYKFVALTIKRWRELRSTVWSDESLDNFIDGAVAPLKRQFESCFHWYSPISPCAYVAVQGTYEANVNRVRDVVKARAKWMDENIGGFYAKINKDEWAQAVNVPLYNCAADGNDDGCLTNPEKYINAVTFPPVRKPYSGPACSNPQPAEQPSIDPCWMSSGMEPRFCNNNGYCPQGPGAKCRCINGKSPPTCANAEEPQASELLSQENVSAVTSTDRKVASVQTWGSAAYLLVLVAGVLAALVVADRRRMRVSATAEERTPLMTRR